MIYILLPVYNEECALDELFNSISSVLKRLGQEYEIVVVDDGSTDATVGMLERYKGVFNLRVCRHVENKGLGVAIKTGFEELFGCLKKGDIIITMDADNTHPPEMIGDIKREIDYGADVVIASRYKDGGVEVGVPFVRRVLSHGANFILRAIFPFGEIRDYSSGYRGYGSRVLFEARKKMGERFIEEKGFSVMAEILIKLSFLLPKIKEVPLTLLYMKRSGKSKIRIADTIKGYIFMIFRLRRMRKLLKNS